MKYLHLITANLLCKKIRTILTIGSFAVALFLFGLLAVELAVQLTQTNGSGFAHILAIVFFAISFVFVYRSFYGMRIERAEAEKFAEMESASR